MGEVPVSNWGRGKPREASGEQTGVRVRGCVPQVAGTACAKAQKWGSRGDDARQEKATPEGARLVERNGLGTGSRAGSSWESGPRRGRRKGRKRDGAALVLLRLETHNSTPSLPISPHPQLSIRCQESHPYKQGWRTHIPLKPTLAQAQA